MAIVEQVDWALVTRVVDWLIPEDEYPSASQAGVVARLASGAAGENQRLWAELLAPGFAALQRELGGRELGDVTDDELAVLLTRVAAGQVAAAWPVDAPAFHEELMRVTAEQFYGSHGTAAWRMVGFDPAPRQRFQAVEQGRGLGPPVRLDQAHHDVDALAPQFAGGRQHGEGLADARRGAEEDLQPGLARVVLHRLQQGVGAGIAGRIGAHGAGVTAGGRPAPGSAPAR